MVLLAPIHSPNSMRMARLNSYSEDITRGLFSVLRKTMESSSDFDINNGVGLTSSELVVLTEYTANQLDKTPQFITVSLYGLCNAIFTSEPVVNEQNGVQPVKTNSSFSYSCLNKGKNYFFDYRRVLSDLGLNIVIDYAYTGERSDTSLVDPSVKPYGFSTSYNKFIRLLRKRKTVAFNLMIAMLVMELIVVVLTYWYYSIKGRFINEFKERSLVHAVSILTLVIFICGLCGIVTIAWVNITLRTKIRVELGTLGFSYHLGEAFFVCLWFIGVLVSIQCFSWTVLEWCVVKTAMPIDDSDFTSSNILHGQLQSFTDSRSYSFHNLDYSTQQSSLAMKTKSSNGHKTPQTSNISSDGIHNASQIPFTSKQVQSNQIGNDFWQDEDYELQSITFRSSTDSNFSVQRVINPSSTMHF